MSFVLANFTLLNFCVLVFNPLIFSALSSLSYEKVCVLFNIAALQSGIAALQSVENDDGLKLAAKLLQVTILNKFGI